MLNEFLFTKIEVEDIGNIWFQQDATQPKLYSIFCALFLQMALSAAELMSFGHLGAYLWGTVKDKCYADKTIKIVAFEAQKTRTHSLCL